MDRLDGKVAIITGASRGLGKDIAVSLAKQGAKVMVAARTNEASDSKIPGSLQHTAQLIRDAGGSAEAVRCDVTSEDDIANTVQQTLDTFGRIDILVNNAGILIPGTVMDMQRKHWKLIFAVNVDGPFDFCRAVIPHLQAVGGGHIINVSSRGRFGPGPGPYGGPPTPPTPTELEAGSGGDPNDPTNNGGAAYGATKAALERFSQGLAAELYTDKISVNVLSPHIGLWSEGGAYFRQMSGDENYSGWRMTGEIIGDASVVICNQKPGVFTGNILFDEFVMRDQGGLGDEVMIRYPVES